MTDMAETTGTTADALLVHAGWMRTLAIRLVRDPDRADDVVQQSFVAALERPPRHTGNLRGWLQRVVTNRARQMGRSEDRRERRERANALPDALPSAEELVVEAELQREIVTAILTLDEPYRSTVLLRFYRDLTPKEIAARLGVPAATVRSRLKRALETLRCDLDRQHGGDRRAWGAAVLPFARVAAVAVLSVKAKVALAAAVVALAAWIGSGLRSPRAPAPVDVAPIAAADPFETLTPLDEAGIERSTARITPPAPEQDEGESAPVPATLVGAYVGSVSDPEGTPIPGARLRIYPKDRGAWPDQEPLAEGTADANGQFEIPVPDGLTVDRYLLIEASAASHQTLSMDPVVPESPIAITLNWTTELFGYVVDDDTEERLAGVRIAARGRGVTSGGDGSYRIDGVPVAQAVTVTLTKDGYAPLDVALNVPTRESVERTFRLTRGEPMRLTVIDESTGAPLRGATVSRYYGDLLGATSAEGALDLRVAEGTKLELEVKHDGYVDCTWHFEVKDSAEFVSPTVPMRGVGVIEGTLKDAAGAPLVGVYLYASNGARDSMSADEQRGYRIPGDLRYRIPRGLDGPTDESGRFTLHVIPSEAPFTVRGGSPEHVAVAHGPVQVTDGGQRVWLDLVQRAGGSVRGRALYNGAGFSRGTVFCEAATGEPCASRIDVEGRFLIEGIPAGEVRLWLRDDGRKAGTLPDPVTLVVAAGAEIEHDFVWEDEMASIRGVVLEANGEPASDVYVDARRKAPEGHFFNAGARTDAEGRFELEVLPGDSYRVHAFRERTLGAAEEVAPGTEGVTLVLPAIGAVHVRLVDAATGETVLPVDSVLFGLAWRLSGDDAFRTVRRPPVVDGTIQLTVPLWTESSTLDLEITLTEDGYAPSRAYGVAIAREGETPPVVELELERGLSCTLRIVSEEPLTLERRRGHLIFLLHDDQLASLRGPFPRQGGPSNHRINGVNMWVGSPGLIDQLADFGTGQAASFSGLAPGRYTIAVFPDELEFEPATFELSEDGGTVELEWRRR